MSMLLDALKKSEQQRRLGTRPDIHRDGDTVDDGRDLLRQWLPMGLVVISVLIMSWNGWRQFQAPQILLEAPAVATRSEAVPEAAPGDGSTATAGDRSSARTPVETFEASQEGATAGVRRDPRNPSDALVVTLEEKNGERQDRQRALESFSQYSSPQAESSAAGATSTGGRPDGVAEMTEKPAPTRQEPRRVADERPADQPYEPRTMSYWELPQGVRDSLPEFRVTVLVYADDPKDRFLLINGMRLTEKQELQSGVVLDEIRRDGAVFRARDYRFLVKG